MIRHLALAAALALAGPAAAVGLGPLSKVGATDTDTKGFYLTLINPYPHARSFALEGIGWDSEAPAARVNVMPAGLKLAGNSTRRLLVVASDLAPGETYRFRVCARLADEKSEILIHARVCSKLSARRLP